MKKRLHDQKAGIAILSALFITSLLDETILPRGREKATYGRVFYSQKERVETLLPGESQAELCKLNKKRSVNSAPLQLFYNLFPSFLLQSMI